MKGHPALTNIHMPTTRDRERTMPETLGYGATFTVDRRDGTWTSIGSGGNYMYNALEERIEDETPQHTRTGSVKHVRIETVLDNPDPLVYDDGTSWPGHTPPYWRVVGDHGTNWIAHYHYPVLPRPVMSEHKTSGGKLRSFQDVGTLAGFTWPTFDVSNAVLNLQKSETQVDLLVNLVEAGQLRSLVKEAPLLMKSLIGHLQKSSSVLTNVSWRERVKSGWESSKDASNLFLGYSFGLRPLLADITQLRREIANSTEIVRKTKQRANKPHTWRSSTVSAQPTVSLSPYASYMWKSQKIWDEQPTTICSIRYIDRLRFPDSVISDIGIMARRLGIVPRFEAAWELVPFSFVVDWLAGVNKIAQLLDSKVSYLNRREIIEAALSHRFKYTRHYIWDHPFGSPSPITCGYTTVKAYNREVVTPSGIESIPGGSGFGKMKAALSAALLRQRDFGIPRRSAAKTAYALSRRAASVSRLDNAHPRKQVYKDLQECYQLLIGK